MKPILFNDEMVRAILDGRKTKTRRVVDSIAGMGRVTEFQASHTPGYAWTFRDRRSLWNDLTGSQLLSRCPLGQPGSRLWVREAWIPGYYRDPDGEGGPVVSIIYAADNGDAMVKAPSYELAEDWSYSYSEDGDPPPARRSPVSMPRWASRLTMEITDVRVQRLQDISEEDCWSEGIEEVRYAGDEHGNLRGSVLEDYRHLWDSIAKPGAKWDDDPWVWAISFKRVEA